MKFNIYQSPNKEYRWELISLDNGKTVWASSEWFRNKSYCITNAELVMKGISEYLRSESKKPIILPPKKIINPLGGLLSKGIPKKTISKPVWVPLFSKLTKNG